MKVLILGVAAVQLDAILELRKMGVETFAVAMAKDGPAADAADHFDVINVLDEEAVARHVRANAIDAVYSTGSDLAMPVACRIGERLGLPHFTTSRVAYVCNHKDAMRPALGPDCEGNVPHQVMERSGPVSIPFPAILKPADSQGQRGIFLVRSQAEFEAHFGDAKKFSREGKVIVERYIDGPEVSVNGYMANGVLRFMVASDRETWPEYTGLIHKHVVPGKSFAPETERLMKQVLQDACNRIGILNGPVYFQMKVMDERPYIIEMTPRLDGCHMWNLLARATGVNLMRLTFGHLLFDDLSELDRAFPQVKPMELVFWCQKPGTTMDRSRLELPADAVDHFYYYETGDFIRPVNGRFDKIGYYIRNL
jgi:biotin carboxylase